MAGVPLFQSFFMGGFECSSHRLRSGKRLDMLAATNHDRFVAADFQRLQAHGIFTVRSGLRWPLIEQTPNQYDFSSALPEIRAARRLGMQVLWDVCHYGWPDDLDIFKPAFVRRFARFAAAFARVLKNETDDVPFVCPVNEISFFAWGGGDAGYLNPFERGRGHELKVQLVRTAIEATEAIWDVLPDARILHVEPVINIIAAPEYPHDAPYAEGHRQSQYQAWDMLAGRSWPQLGGDPKYLDILGMNYYSNNQWLHGGRTLHWTEPLYRPFRQIVHEIYERYERPLFVAETGIEDDARPDWLAYVGGEVQAALQAGVPLEGVCLYPIVNHPGWDNDRHCHNGLWDYADANGQREMYAPLGAEVRRQQAAVAAIQTARSAPEARLAIRLSSPAYKPRVCLFTDSWEPSGLGEHMLALATELHMRYAVTFVCPPSPHAEALLGRAAQLPIRVLPLEVRGQARQPWEILRDWLRDEPIDIFHGHAGIGWEGHDGVYAAHYARVPIIVRTEHLPYLITDGGQRARHADMLHQVARLVCVSQGAYASFSAAGVAPEQLTMIRNGIVPRRAAVPRAQMRASLGLPPKAPLVLTVGRLTEQKGHRYLLDAIADVAAAQPTAHFVWIGDWPLAEPLRAERARLGLATRLHLLGQRDDVADWLAAADRFVLPSLFEGLPLVVLEALAAGVPVIATRIPGTDEIIEDGCTGRLVPPGNAAALAAAISETLAKPQQTRAWAAAGRALFAQQFTARRMAQAVDALYDDLLQQTVIQSSGALALPLSTQFLQG